jgi:hypothetical protein
LLNLRLTSILTSYFLFVSGSITSDLRQYLNTRFPKGGLDHDLQNTIRKAGHYNYNFHRTGQCANAHTTEIKCSSNVRIHNFAMRRTRKCRRFSKFCYAKYFRDTKISYKYREFSSLRKIYHIILH